MKSEAEIETKGVTCAITGFGFYLTRCLRSVFIYKKLGKGLLFDWYGVYVDENFYQRGCDNESWLSNGSACIDKRIDGDDIIELIQLIDLEKIRKAAIPDK